MYDQVDDIEQSIEHYITRILVLLKKSRFIDYLYFIFFSFLTMLVYLS